VAGVRNGEVRIVEDVGRDIAELEASRPG
jgi:hypothetical protein